MTSSRPALPTAAPPRTLEQRASRQALIDAANARMGAAKRAALAAYERVHPVGHTRCGETCRVAHRELLRECADANAEYQSAVDERRP